MKLFASLAAVLAAGIFFLSTGVIALVDNAGPYWFLGGTVLLGSIVVAGSIGAMAYFLWRAIVLLPGGKDAEGEEIY